MREAGETEGTGTRIVVTVTVSTTPTKIATEMDTGDSCRLVDFEIFYKKVHSST